MSQARARTHDNLTAGAPETEDILASILNTAAPTAGQRPHTDEQLHDDESFAAFMAFCQDGAPNTEPTTTPALRRLSHKGDPTSPARDPTCMSHQAHLRRSYAALGSAAEALHPPQGTVTQEASQKGWPVNA